MKNDASIRQRSLYGMIWKLLEKCGTLVINFVIQIILARMLLPEEYGLVGLLTVFITIADVFILQGFTTALIQKKDADDTDYSSVFLANLVMSAALYAIMFLGAPAVAAFYKEPQLVEIMRVMSLTVVLGAAGAVHNAIMARNLEFKKSFLRGLSNTLTYAVVGVAMAYLGCGVWSLVYAKLAGLAVGALVLWITVPWRPKAVYSHERVRSMFRYSSKILGTNLLNTVFNNINAIVIGRFYSSTDVGFYQRGQQIPQVVMTAIDGSLNEVMYPTFSRLQDDIGAVKSAMRRSMKTSMYIVIPILIGLIVTAEPLTLFLLTEKWLPSVPYMQLTCVLCMFWPFSARTHALNAIGKSSLTFKMSLVAKSIVSVFLVITLRYGVIAMMLGSICASVISFLITSYFVNQYIHYSLWELIRDILPSFLLAVFMGAVVALLGRLPLGLVAQLIVQIGAGAAIYVAGSILLRIDSFEYLLSMIRRLLGKRA